MFDKDHSLYKEKINECSNAGMLHNENIFNYIYSEVNVPNETIIHNYSKKAGAKKYGKYYDYEGFAIMIFIQSLIKPNKY